MADEAIEIPITIGGADKAAGELGKVAGGMTKLGDEAKKTGTAKLDLAGASQKLSAGLGALGGSLGQVDPLLGQFGASLGRAGGAIGSMTALIGGGPGVLFGGAVAVIGLLASAYRDSANAADEMQSSISDTISSLDAQIKKTNEAAEAQRRFNELQAGGGTLGERSAMASLAATKLANLENPGLWDRMTVSDDVRQAQIAAARRELDFYSAPTLGSGEETIIENGAVLRPGDPGWDAAVRAATGKSPRGGGRGGAANDNGASSLDAFLSDARGRADFGLSEDGDPRSYGLEGLKPMDAQAESIGSLTGGGSRSGADRSIKDAEMVKNAWGDAFSTIETGATDAFAALVQGNGEAAVAIIAQTGNQMVAEGSKAVFSGLIQAAGGNPQGLAVAALGAAEIAFGATLGATLGGASSGGGGGRAARPSSGMSRSEARESGPSITNVYALDPTAEAGKAVERSVRKATRKRMVA